MKKTILIASIVMTTVAFGQGMSGQDSQNGQAVRGQQDGNGSDRDGRDDGRNGRDDGRNGRDDGRNGRDDGRNGRDDGRDDNGRNGRTAICQNYAPFNMCTGQDLFVWKAPYVDRRTTRYECMDLCNRKLREMNFRGDACCQLQHHPDYPSNCKLKDGTLRNLGDNAGSTVGAAMCERGYEPPRPTRTSTCKPYDYTRFSMCTGRDIQVWTPPYVSRRTTSNDCIELCNRQLKDMNWNGYACCQLQHHPDYPSNCRLRDGMTNAGAGDSVGAVNCGPDQNRR